MSDPALLDRLGALARRRPIEIALAIVVLAGGGSWVYAGVRSALSDLAANNLRSLLASEVVALETWIGEKRLNVQRWALDPRVVAAATALSAEAERSPQALAAACRGALGDQVVGAIETLRQADAAASIHLIDPAGRILAARDRTACAAMLDDARRAAFAPALQGRTTFTAPRGDAERIGRAASGTRAEPKVWIAAPVRDEAGRILAVLDIGKPARERFAPLFRALRTGAGGEAYAFDADGRLLSESRYGRELEAAGALAAGDSAMLRVRLTVPAAIDGNEPFTQLAAQATSAQAAASGARDGVLVEPYPNYAGVPVLGAWHWFDDYAFGIAEEIAASEAFAPLQRLDRAFQALALVIGLAAFGLIVALLRIRRLMFERDEARRVGNYELLEQVGQGGMARVYRARHRLLKRPTAVKIIELAKADDEALARFDREVRLASQLMHPNTIEVFDYGRTPEGQPFYAMEFIDGLTLQQIVERHGPLPPARVAHVLRGIAGSLGEAHAQGLVHRDIKPPNVMLCRRGGEYDVVKVLDFGLVKDVRGEATRDLTRALRVLGTPAYMAPERIERPDGADVRADLYALGAVGFYLLAGRAPFVGDNDLALAYQVVNSPVPDVAALAPYSVPQELVALITACLAKSPDARPGSCGEVIDILDRLLARAPWTSVEARTWWNDPG